MKDMERPTADDRTYLASYLPSNLQTRKTLPATPTIHGTDSPADGTPIEILISPQIQLKNMADSVTIDDVYQGLKRLEEKMVTREDIDALLDSIEIINNPKTMEKLRKSDRDIKEGRVKEVTSVKDLLGEIRA